MLNKLLANLPFNPSLIGQISFYAKRLKKEKAVRRLGFMMLSLAMLVQLFAALSPPQPSLARSSNDLILGGITEQGQAVLHCLNSGGEDYGKILAFYGISCTDLSEGHSSVVSINAHDYGNQLYSMGRNPQGFASEQPVSIDGTNGGHPLYIRYLWEWPSSRPYQALSLIMHGQQFFILFDCGNLVSVGVPQPPAPTPTPTPQPQPQPQPPADKPSIGYLDVVDCNKIAGWAFDQDKPAATLEVHIYIDGQGAAITQANVSRTDVGAAYPGAGSSHGYSISTPASIKNTSTHTVNAYAIGIDASGNKNNINPLIGSKTVALGTCAPSTPPPTFTPGNASCVSLKAINLGNRTYNFIATSGGDDYVVNNYNFDFGDNNSKSVNSSLYLSSTNHTYSQAGSYTARVTIEVRVSTSTNSSVVKSLTCQTSLTISETPPPPSKPCEEAQSSENLEVCLVPHKQAKNVSRGGSDANGRTAHAGETIVYTLSDKNVGTVTVPNHIIRESVSDILDYADITDLHGGTVDKYKIVSWPASDVKAGQTLTVYLTVKIKNPIPNTPVSASDPGHFDHRLTNVYGDTVVINLPGNIVSVTQRVNTTLVNTGPGTSMMAIVGLTIVVGYFFARSRLISEEVDIVRREYAATGGL